MLAEPIGVLVADDEPRQRRGLAALIRSLRPAYRVYEARNGKEALKLVRESAPEFVFTDIQMPLASGLEFLEAVGRLPQGRPKVVLVSVYSEFSYAQQALRLGAKDYLLKPVRPEQLADVLEKLEEQLVRERERSPAEQKWRVPGTAAGREAVQGSAEDARHEADHARRPAAPDTVASRLYAEHLLHKWMASGELTAGEREEWESRFGLAGPGRVILLETSGPGGGTPEPSDGGFVREEEWRGMLRQTALRALASYADAAASAPDHEPGRLYIAAAWKTGCSPAEALGRLRDAVQRLARVYGRTVGAAIGREVPRIERDAHESYRNAIEALDRLFYARPGTWLDAGVPGDAKQHADVGPLPSARDIDALEEAAASCDEAKAAGLLAEALDRIARSGPPPMRAKLAAMQLLLGCMQRTEFVLDEADSRELSERIERQILASPSWADVKAAAERLLCDLICRLKVSRQSRIELIMRKCREYIDAHLHENLGLEAVAQRFYYNPSYFSILFKQHAGMPFSEYLAQARMRKARELLLNTNLRVAEIACRVGYKDTKYFNKVFRKMFLCSPDEFRRMFAARHEAGGI
ncbi:MAG: hypothetical protein A9Z00_00370 [Thermobacillus sp. ZCTH02-B1]|uniref:response regulator n=1 Tax=Thermobacillus sp. ZCTH02-B1 TaxID=1858795 RepID=UPI000B56E1D4|nr:response regulator [Thermobacillus sp. ZCTH02-B1]OUM94122.1 MAG: hypothetical protein A9Z00_00370 [Thermobacillus sp. ZCTH02-B1]